ncbi:unnamed protein product, partial [Closterium sp. Naga37s-1]
WRCALASALALGAGIRAGAVRGRPRWRSALASSPRAERDGQTQVQREGCMRQCDGQRDGENADSSPPQPSRPSPRGSQRAP